MKTFSYVNTKNYKLKSRNEKKLGRHFLVISVEKYDVSILQTKLSIKTNCH